MLIRQCLRDGRIDEGRRFIPLRGFRATILGRASNGIDTSQITERAP